MVSSLHQEMLANLMDTAIEHTGAQKSFLILPTQAEPTPGADAVDWFVEAEGTVDADTAIVLPSIPLGEVDRDRDLPLLPASIVNHVARSRRPLAIDNAEQLEEFAQDPYIRSACPAAILCVPLIHETQLSGILYLEKQQAATPFTAEHLKILEILSAPVAISIENSRLVAAQNQELQEKNANLSSTLQALEAQQQQIMAQEKFTYIARLTANIAHELKNRLVYINGFAEVSVRSAKKLLDKLAEPERTLDDRTRNDLEKTLTQLIQNTEKIGEHGHKADRLVRDIRQHFQGEKGKRQRADINDLVQEALEQADRRIKMRNLDAELNFKIETNYDRSLEPIDLVSQNIFYALSNILNNAFFAIQEKANQQSVENQNQQAFIPTLTINTKNSIDAVEIRIKDNGKGIPSEIREKIFELFFTTNSPEQGTGLGLWISHNIIVGEHQGQIEVNSEVGQYSEFIITLPKNCGE